MLSYDAACLKSLIWQSPVGEVLKYASIVTGTCTICESRPVGVTRPGRTSEVVLRFLAAATCVVVRAAIVRAGRDSPLPRYSRRPDTARVMGRTSPNLPRPLRRSADYPDRPMTTPGLYLRAYFISSPAAGGLRA